LQTVVEWMANEFTVVADAAPVPTLAEAVCADGVDAVALAHLLISVARAWGAPARFVRGYRDPAYADDDVDRRRPAWAEALVPGAGWRGLDPCTALVTNDTYVTVAVGRDALDCPPVRSACKGETMAEVSAVSVRGAQGGEQ